MKEVNLDQQDFGGCVKLVHDLSGWEVYKRIHNRIYNRVREQLREQLHEQVVERVHWLVWGQIHWWD